MQRLPIIETALSHAIQARQAIYTGNSITPYFYSIRENDEVIESQNVVTAISGSPKLILLATLRHYEYYGKRTDAEIFACLTGDDFDSKIIGERFTASEIRFEGKTIIQAVKFKLNTDYKDILELDFYGSRTDSPFKGFQVFWNFFREINKECTTIGEIEIYLKLFNQMVKNEVANSTIKEYQNTIESQKNLINQYEGLLEDIKELIKDKA